MKKNKVDWFGRSLKCAPMPARSWQRLEAAADGSQRRGSKAVKSIFAQFYGSEALIVFNRLTFIFGGVEWCSLRGKKAAVLLSMASSMARTGDL